MAAERQTSDARRGSRWPSRARSEASRGFIAWTGVPLRRLPAPPPPPWDRGRRLCHFSISMALWRCRRPPRAWHCAAALLARPIYRAAVARRLQRALGDGELHALALQARIELIDTPFGLGPIGSGVDLDLGDAVGQRLYLLLGMGKRGLTRLQRLR